MRTYQIKNGIFHLNNVVYDDEAIKQNVLTRLQLEKGELEYNLNAGIEWRNTNDIIQQYGIDYLNGMIKNEILKIYGIDYIEKYSSQVKNRTFIITELSIVTKNKSYIEFNNLNLKVIE